MGTEFDVRVETGFRFSAVEIEAGGAGGSYSHNNAILIPASDPGLPAALQALRKEHQKRGSHPLVLKHIDDKINRVLVYQRALAAAKAVRR